jgi:hypothetical protein
MDLKELARIYPFVKRDMRENNKEKRKEEGFFICNLCCPELNNHPRY